MFLEYLLQLPSKLFRLNVIILFLLLELFVFWCELTHDDDEVKCDQCIDTLDTGDDNTTQHCCQSSTISTGNI